MTGKRPMRHDQVYPDESTTSKVRRTHTEDFDVGSRRHEPRLSYRDYTILWMTALPIELAAAEMMLDCYHPALPQLQGDGNIYVLGSVAGHNVVIACLPKGRYGSVSAVITMVDARRTFTALRCTLMVGIGGAIPDPTNDLRLGDVVVGTEVLAFSLIEPTGHGVQRIGEGKRCDETLLKVVTSIEGSWARDGDKAPRRMMAIMERAFATTPHYLHPQLPDHLFKPSYSHTDLQQLDCQKCCDYKSGTVLRQARPSTNPRIHLGVIASSEVLIKEAKARDVIGRKLGAVCFEMEAAGLMGGPLPCLPIRGISDYSDTHKNKHWQRYAAAAAASYAREVLEAWSGRAPKV